MTNNELEQLLKATKIPERENSFWENFPQTVMRKIRSGSSSTNDNRRPKLNCAFWGIGLATACLVIGFWFGFRNGHSRGTDEQLAVARKYFQEIKSLFPNQIRSLAFHNGEPRLLLSEKPDVPDSAPLFVKICSGKSCKSFVTFSGQQIQINGETFEVLSARKGEILLVGSHSIWSSADPVNSKNHFIRAQSLQL